MNRSSIQGRVGTTRNKTPSFRGYKTTSSLSSRIKTANRSKDTRHELKLSWGLHRLGLRFKRHDKMLPGKPDFVFSSARVAVFCDGDFWHGRSWRELKAKLANGSNAKYWIAKVESNILRDKRVRKVLSKLGWQVVRVWEKDINRDPKKVANRIASLVSGRRSGSHRKHNPDDQHIGYR